VAMRKKSPSGINQGTLQCLALTLMNG
jgi:hypothetical protein